MEVEAKCVQHAEALRGRDTQLAAKAEAVSSLQAKVLSLSEALEKVRRRPHLPVKSLLSDSAFMQEHHAGTPCDQLLA